MPTQSTVVYSYDGSFDGLMCCVFESFDKREMPAAILPWDAEQPTLFPLREIETNPERAARVRKSIPLKISLEAKELIEQAFLTNLAEKELHILRFMRRGYQEGGKICSMLTDDTVSVLKKAVLFLSRESHLHLGFIRFSEYDGVLLSVITPKNNILPVIAPHFCSRYSGEAFMIFDKTHKMALIYRDGKREFIHVDRIEPPEAGPQELHYRALWRKFYDTIGIEGRYNPLCRRTHMPMRYWENMTEFT